MIGMLISGFGCLSQEVPENGNPLHADFELTYMSAGLGSGMGSMQPTFRVQGTKYVYTYEQNSYYGEKSKQPEMICSGRLRLSSIDSILFLIKEIEDTEVYRTNVDVLSGGIQSIKISNKNTDLIFKLHNASDPIAKEIVDILNTNIPSDKRKLYLFFLPETDFKIKE